MPELGSRSYLQVRLWHLRGEAPIDGISTLLLLIPGDAGDISGGELRDAPLKSAEEEKKKEEAPPQKNGKPPAPWQGRFHTLMGICRGVFPIMFVSLQL